MPLIIHQNLYFQSSIILQIQTMSLQVVWIKSTQLGVAKAEKKSGGTVLVFRYSPPGNSGQYAENL